MSKIIFYFYILGAVAHFNNGFISTVVYSFFVKIRLKKKRINCGGNFLPHIKVTWLLFKV